MTDGDGPFARRLLPDAWPVHLAVAWIAFGRPEMPSISPGADADAIIKFQNAQALMWPAARWLATVIPNVRCAGRRPSDDGGPQASGIPHTFGPSTFTLIDEDTRARPCEIPAEWLGLRRTEDQSRPGDIVLFAVDEDETRRPRFMGFHSVYVSRADVEREYRTEFGDHGAGRTWSAPPPDGFGVPSPEADGEGVSTPGRPTRKPALSKDGLRAWFLLRVKCWPEDAPPPTEQQDLDAAQLHFEGKIPRDLFRAIRREKAPEAWKKRGPRAPQ